MHNLDGYGDEMQMNGLFKRLRKKLKRVVKSKVFKKIAAVAAVGAAIYFGGPAAMSLLKKQGARLAYKKLGKKLKKRAIKKLGKRSVSRKAPKNILLRKKIVREIKQIRRLPANQQESALLRAPAITYNAENNIRYATRPYYEQEFINQGMPPQRARRRANVESTRIAKATVADFKQTAQPKSSALIPIAAAAAVALIAKG